MREWWLNYAAFTVECRTFVEWIPGASTEALRSWIWDSDLVFFRIQLRLQLAFADAILTPSDGFLESVGIMFHASPVLRAQVVSS